LWDNRKTIAGLVDVWEAANRDDLVDEVAVGHTYGCASTRDENRFVAIRSLPDIDQARDGLAVVPQ